MPITGLVYGAKVTSGYEVANSLRFNDGSSDYLNRTLSSSGNRKTFTISFWQKLGTGFDADRAVITGGTNTSNYFMIRNQSTQGLQILDYASADNVNLVTNRKFRDVSAWYHIVVAVDTTQGTASNRVRLYVNGVEETSFSTETNPDQNDDLQFNNDTSHAIGRREPASNLYFDGYLAEFVLIDGQQLDATSFGEFDSDTNIWKPKDVSGLTFGTNGFYLDFENSSSLGADVSGNGNNFTVNNLTSIDQTTDTCTNNFATFNPLIASNDPVTYSEGNCKIASAGTNGTGNSYFGGASTFMVSQGKWYCEFKYSAKETLPRLGYGISYDPQEAARSNDTATGGSARNVIYDCQSGDVVNSGTTISAYGDTWDQGDIIGIALDLDNDALYFSKNGTFQNSGDPTSGSSKTGAVSITTGKTWSFIILDNNNDLSQTTETNFGNPTFSISSGNSDANGYGNFEYSVPSGYYALNSKNLAEYG